MFREMCVSRPKLLRNSAEARSARRLSQSMAALALLIAATAAVNAQPRSSEACSIDYHAALAGERDVALLVLAPANKQLRLADPQLPGRWLFPEPARHVRPPGETADRLCAEPIVRAGRTRCARWAAPDAEMVPEEPDDAELRNLRPKLDGVVTGKGVPAEFGKNGRYDWLVRRVASDLRTYMNQPAHPEMCAGVPEMLDFFVGNLAGLRRRAAEVTEIADAALALARARVNEEALPSGGTSTGTHASDPVSQATSDERIRELVSHAQKLMAAGAGARPIAMLAAEPGPAALITQLQEHLLAAGTPVSTGVARAFRAVETAAYALLLQERHKGIDTALFGAIGTVRNAHRDHCACSR